MPSDPPQRQSKRERQEARRDAARVRRRRTGIRRAGILAAVLLLPLLWLVDCMGPEETVQAEVLRTRLWRHGPPGGQAHTHTSATLVIEGLTEATLDRADGLARGQRFPVRIRRGRLTGWPYFVGPEDAEARALQAEEEALARAVEAEVESAGADFEGTGLEEPELAPERGGDPPPEGGLEPQGGLEFEGPNE